MVNTVPARWKTAGPAGVVASARVNPERVAVIDEAVRGLRGEAGPQVAADAERVLIGFAAQFGPGVARDR